MPFKAILSLFSIHGISFSIVGRNNIQSYLKMKTANYLFLTLFVYLLGLSNLAAKEVSRISGKILDQKGAPVAYANVALIAVEGNGLIDGAVSDEDGSFIIESVKSAKVSLVVSSIGFNTYTSEPFEA